MALPCRRFGDDRGAILVHVALSLLALLAFSAFTIDYGVLWASRRQAQNSADAAALAGALAYIQDPAKDTSDAGAAKQNAFTMSQINVVWGDSPNVNVTTDITFPACPDGTPATCIRVDVYRTGARGNPLPVFFGMFFGLVNHDIRATATAKVVTANSSECLRPFGVPDLFIDNNGNGEYDAGDTYDPGDVGPPIDPGTGYSSEPEAQGGHYGTRIILKNGPHGNRIMPGWFFALDYGSGAKTYEDAIRGCVGVSYGIGDIVEEETGVMQGPTRDGIGDLIDYDPDAYYDDSTDSIVDSCVEDGEEGICPGYAVSPRVVPIPVFDPAHFAATGEIKIAKILGYFIEDPDDVDPSLWPPDFDDKFDVLGVLINVPGMFDGSNAPAGPGTFLQTAILIR